MYIATVPNRGSPPAILLRESYREGDKVKTRTLANLSKLPGEAIEAVRRVLKGDKLVDARDAFEVTRSLHHGHVEAVSLAIRKLGLESVLGKPSRHRDLVLAMIAGRILAAGSKLKLTRSWQTTTLPETFGVSGATEDELYDAMDWLLGEQPSIEARLAKRHLEPCALVLYDLTSTWYEGATCPLAKRGYSRDGKSNSLQINFGLLTDGRGCPVAVSVYDGSTADSKTVMAQVERAKKDFKLDLIVLVGDRGMITQMHIDQFKKQGGVEWITAMKTPAIRRLREGGQLQLDLFDERNLFEMESPEYPGERLIACRNPELAKRRAHKRKELLDATVADLEGVKRSIAAGRLRGKAEIGLRVGRVINKRKVAKHFKVKIATRSLTYEIDQEKVDAEAALDGIYVIRTSVAAEAIDAPDTVRAYKKLTQVERAFRTTKTIDLRVRPIFHRTENRVRAHIFLWMLAYYVEWHMRDVLAPLLFADDAKPSGADPVAPAKRSIRASKKAAAKTTADGLPAHSFDTLLHDLSTIVRNTCRRREAAESEPSFDLTTTPSDLHRRALSLLETIQPRLA
jgi:transposase